MGAVTSTTRFGELDRLGVELTVTCQKCRHVTRINGREPAIADRRVVGVRFRCHQPGCGGIGLPTLGKERRWTQALAEHARALRTRTAP